MTSFNNVSDEGKKKPLVAKVHILADLTRDSSVLSMFNEVSKYGTARYPIDGGA
jgi:hypothetical protein